jgi:hypothetical protein
MSDLSRDARDLIARARAAERTDASAKKRVRAALTAHLGVPPGLPATPSVPAAAVGAGFSASKIVLICSLTAASLVGTAVVVKAKRASQPAAQVVVRPSSPSIALPVPPAPSEAMVPSEVAPVIAARETPVSAQPRRVVMRTIDPAPRPARVAEPSETPKPIVASPQRQPQAAAAPAPVPPSVVVAPTVPLAPPAGGDMPSSSWQSSRLPTPVPDRPLARIPSAPAPTKECTAERELGLLSGAQAALREGNGRRALDLLEQHAQNCPAATFWQERSAARVLALCLLHRDAQAVAEASQLASVAPRSPLLARLRTSCAASAVKP